MCFSKIVKNTCLFALTWEIHFLCLVKMRCSISLDVKAYFIQPVVGFALPHFTADVKLLALFRWNCLRQYDHGLAPVRARLLLRGRGQDNGRSARTRIFWFVAVCEPYVEPNSYRIERSVHHKWQIRGSHLLDGLYFHCFQIKEKIPINIWKKSCLGNI